MFVPLIINNNNLKIDLKIVTNYCQNNTCVDSSKIFDGYYNVMIVVTLLRLNNEIKMLLIESFRCCYFILYHKQGSLLIT